MSLEVQVVHAQHNGDAAPAPSHQIAKNLPHESHPPRADIQHPRIVQSTDPQSSPPPASQESLQSTTSKQTTFTSVEPLDGRQFTPTSSASRQESLSPVGPGNASNGLSGTLSRNEHLPAYTVDGTGRSEPSHTHSPAVPFHVDTTAGQKRTADGLIKDSRASSTESPIEGSARHGRTTSTASRSSQLGELSAQLKARLTYAKVKVEHGWESRTFKEIETLASQPGSPARTEFGARDFKSPRTTLYAPSNSEQALSRADRPLTAPSRHLQYGQYHNGPGDAYQSQSHLGSHAPPSRASLAPPVELSNPRRSPQVAHNPPALATGGSHSTMSACSQSPAQSLYDDNGPARIRGQDHLKTPSQNTAEQDAIETLLFMRSPGNSAAFSQALPTNGLSAAINLAPASHVSYAPAQIPRQPAPRRQMPITDVAAIPLSPRRPDVEERVLAHAKLHDSKGIDKALDEIRRRALVEGQDVDSSDEEEI